MFCICEEYEFATFLSFFFNYKNIQNLKLEFSFDNYVFFFSLWSLGLCQQIILDLFL